MKPGMTVNAFIQQDNGIHKFDSVVKLIERLNTWYSPEPFPIVEHCPLCKQTTNNVKEKWLVEVTTGGAINNTIRCIRYIHKFHSYGTPHVRDEMDVDDKEYSESDKWYEEDVD